MLSAQTKYLLKQQSNVIIGFYYFIIMSWPHVVELQVTTVCFFFNVSLTVHLSIILLIDQLNAQILVLQ